jgi:hypothetical protein
VTLATATANEQAQGPGPRGPVLDPTDEVGAFLAQKPSQITAAKAAELLVAAKPWEQTQLVSVIHARMGNQFLQQVIALLTPAQLDALHGKAAPDELASFPGLEDVTSTAPPAVDYSGVDERGGYAHHPTLAYQNYTQQYGDDGTQTRLEDADPAAAASRNAANRATLDASNVEDRIAGLERLRKSLPKTKASIALSGAITAELWDLQHDRNLLDSDPKTKPWIGNRVDIPTRKAIYPGHVPTDCTEYVDKVFREAMAQVGQAGLAQSVLDYAHATAKRARDGRELYSGVDMQRALCAKLGWKSAYIDESGDKAAVSRKGGAETFYRGPGGHQDPRATQRRRDEGQARAPGRDPVRDHHGELGRAHEDAGARHRVRVPLERDRALPVRGHAARARELVAHAAHCARGRHRQAQRAVVTRRGDVSRSRGCPRPRRARRRPRRCRGARSPAGPARAG